MLWVHTIPLGVLWLDSAVICLDVTVLQNLLSLNLCFLCIQCYIISNMLLFALCQKHKRHMLYLSTIYRFLLHYLVLPYISLLCQFCLGISILLVHLFFHYQDDLVVSGSLLDLFNFWKCHFFLQTIASVSVFYFPRYIYRYPNLLSNLVGIHSQSMLQVQCWLRWYQNATKNKLKEDFFLWIRIF